MSAELIGAVKQLVALLKRHFTVFGNPPVSPRWIYPVPFPTSQPPEMARAHAHGVLERLLDMGQDLTRFSVLLDDPPDPRMVELFDGVAPLLTVAQTLRDVEQRLQSTNIGAERLRYLFGQLSERDWANSVTASVEFEDGQEVGMSIGFQLKPIEEQVLADILNATEEIGTTRGSDMPLLGERARLVLQSLLKKRAFDSDHRVTTEEVATAATGRIDDANQFKEVISELKAAKYVVTKKGRGGGCWLTDDGRRRAEKL